jgi:hypothetical protein
MNYLFDYLLMPPLDDGLYVIFISYTLHTILWVYSSLVWRIEGIVSSREDPTTNM